jgi:hypothetical protein
MAADIDDFEMMTIIVMLAVLPLRPPRTARARGPAPPE